jgi:SAM-dependent methyltransferase
MSQEFCTMGAQFDTVDFNHSRNPHSVLGPDVALRLFLERVPSKSLLDVGCGRGTWVRAAIRHGLEDVLGVDGVAVPEQRLLFPKDRFQQRDLRAPFDLRREFDLLTCLEVAEHLPAESAPHLVVSLTKHSRRILFAAACPGQPGQHHVNCQWPDYWQALFNQHGYTCSDWPRWLIWMDQRIEPWYRQNTFFAERQPELAGKEARIMPVLHPDLLAEMFAPQREETERNVSSCIEAGQLPGLWYVKTFGRALWQKAMRRLSIRKARKA